MSFWITQPVWSDAFATSGIIQENLKVSDSPIGLLPQFEWKTLNVNVNEDLEAIYTLLRDHYVTGSHCKLYYSKSFLKWALNPSDYSWCIGVCVKSSNKLVGFVYGCKRTISILGNVNETAEVNFLCIHKKLRNKKLAPTLIKEITQRVYSSGLRTAVFTSARELPHFYVKHTYYHRMVCIDNLYKNGFLAFEEYPLLAKYKRESKIDPKWNKFGLMQINQNNKLQIAMCKQLLFTTHSERSQIYYILDKDFDHMLKAPEDIMQLFCIQKEISTTIESHEKSSEQLMQTEIIVESFAAVSFMEYKYPRGNVRVAQLYHHAAKDGPLMKNMIKALLAKFRNKIDVFNCIDGTFTNEVINELGFRKGSGEIYGYLYNYSKSKTTPENDAIVML